MKIKADKALEKLSKKQFEAELAKLAASLRADIEANVSGFARDERAQKERRSHVFDEKDGFKFFAETYFPHYLLAAPSLLHEYLFARLSAIATAPRERHDDVVIAPRASAKSTLISLIYPIWRALIRRSRYIIIIMDAYAQAALQIEGIKAELEENPRLKADFPELAGKGRMWREGQILTKNNCLIEGVGAGMKLRGRKHGPHRPDLVVLDDIENDENVRSPEQRDKLENWILKAVRPLGGPDGTMDLLHIGTVLHSDAVILRNAARPGWNVVRFKALMHWPDNMAAWDEWEEILRNDGEAVAKSFYAAYKAAMDKGAVLNWPAMQTLLQLMEARAMSQAAFAAEQQGEPVSDNSPFRLEDISFWVQKPAKMLYFGAVDPSLGRKGKARDPSAILIGGVDKSGAYPVLTVLEASIRKRLPDTIIEDILTYQAQYKCQLWFVEAVQFQEFLRTELMKRALVRGLILPAIPVTPNTDKALRIESLQPHIMMGGIKLHSTQRTLIEQLTQWPAAAHDDGPDCLQMLYAHAIKYAVGGLTNPDAIRTAPRRRQTGKLFKGYSL